MPCSFSHPTAIPGRPPGPDGALAAVAALLALCAGSPVAASPADLAAESAAARATFDARVDRLAGAATRDTVSLRDGSRHEGLILQVQEAERKLLMHVERGRQREFTILPLDDVASFDWATRRRKEAEEAVRAHLAREFAMRVRPLTGSDPAPRLELARWAAARIDLANELRDAAAGLCLGLTRLDPPFRPDAVAEILGLCGYRKTVHYGWAREEEVFASHGFVRRAGRWVTAELGAALDAVLRLEAEVGRARAARPRAPGGDADRAAAEKLLDRKTREAAAIVAAEKDVAADRARAADLEGQERLLRADVAAAQATAQKSGLPHDKARVATLESELRQVRNEQSALARRIDEWEGRIRVSRGRVVQWEAEIARLEKSAAEKDAEKERLEREYAARVEAAEAELATAQAAAAREEERQKARMGPDGLPLPR